MDISDFKHQTPVAVVAGFYYFEKAENPLLTKDDFRKMKMMQLSDERGLYLIRRDTRLGLKERPDAFTPLRVYHVECLIQKPAILSGVEYASDPEFYIPYLEGLECGDEIDTILVLPAYESDPRRYVILLDPENQVVHTRLYEVITPDPVSETVTGVFRTY